MTASQVLAVEQRRRALAAALTGCWALALGLLGLGDAVLYFLPALLLFVLLALGRYPGERTYGRWLAAHRHRRRRPAPFASQARSPLRARVKGGALLAFRLAGRGPPPLLG
jgi:hypothetical protein